MAVDGVDVIDLISSSPPPLDKQGFDRLLAPHSPTPPRAASRSDRMTLTVGTSSSSRDLIVTSPVLVDLQPCDELPDLVARGQKRRRVSETPSSQRMTASRPPSGLPEVSRQHQPQLRSSLLNDASRNGIEVIDFTSSLDMGESRLRSQASTRASSTTGLQRPSKTAIPNSDIFLSSPIVLRTLRKKDNLSKDDPDTLACSQARPTRSSNELEATAVHSDSSDPFASSPISKPQAGGLSANFTNHPKNTSRKDWDPISSSAPEQSLQKSVPDSRHREVIELSSDADYVQDSDDEFPDIADFVVSKPRSPLQRSQSDNIASKRRKPNAAPKKTVEQRKRERDANAAIKAVEKERKQREREQAKEAKKREKERAAALAEVNKVRTDKKVSTPEMIVMIPASIEPGLKVQVESLLRGLGVQFVDWESPAGTTFKWRRKVKSRFDEDMGRWEPMPLQIKPEKHALTILTAEELVEDTLNGDLDSSVRRTKEHFPGHEMVYMIQGMNAWIRRNRNIRNRQFASVVRQGADAAGTQSRRRNRTSNEEHISEDTVEDAMLRLQVEHGVLIHHTETQLDTAQWIVQFTQHISTIPYKKQRDEATASAGFCMESGQVRTGEDAQDTYVRLLQEIVRVTAPIAHGIAAEFDTVSKLVKGLERGGSSTLADLRKSTNRDGGFSDRTIGQAVSKRIYKVFTGRDEGSTDV